MEIDAAKVKAMRTGRSWTQQHLADACGVSLRTIQRIERYGTTSFDTLMSLAAVFELEQQQLTVQEPKVIETRHKAISPGKVYTLMAISAIGGAVLGAWLSHLFTA